MAAARAVSRVGPARLTLADVAAEAGVVPATLVQRFGSKRGLLLALAKVSAAASAGEFAALRAAHPSPLAAVRAVAACVAGMASTPGELANHLAFLVMDLTDPDFHAHALAVAKVYDAELTAMLNAAVAAGELVKCDTAALARLIGALLHGSLVSWAIVREGAAADWVRRELDALLAPYLPAKRRPAKRRRGR
jgi:AcrR family transcriptional regulator